MSTTAFLIEMNLDLKLNVLLNKQQTTAATKCQKKQRKRKERMRVYEMQERQVSLTYNEVCAKKSTKSLKYHLNLNMHVHLKCFIKQFFARV